MLILEEKMYFLDVSKWPNTILTLALEPNPCKRNGDHSVPIISYDSIKQTEGSPQIQLQSTTIRMWAARGTGATSGWHRKTFEKSVSLLGKSINPMRRARGFFPGTEQGICVSRDSTCSVTDRTLLGRVSSISSIATISDPQSTCPYSVPFFEQILLRRQNPSPSICFTKYLMKPRV